MPTITIDRNYAGHVLHNTGQGTYTKVENPHMVYVGTVADKEYTTGWYRFPLTSLPAGASVSQVLFRVYCLAGGSAGEWDICGYDDHGQDNPADDNAETTRNKSVYQGRSGYSGTGSPLYVDKITEFRTDGNKEIDLGFQACTDVENAKSAVNRFTIGIWEYQQNDPHCMLQYSVNPGYWHGILVITYTVPLAAGYQYSDGLVHISVLALVRSAILSVCGKRAIKGVAG